MATPRTAVLHARAKKHQRDLVAIAANLEDKNLSEFIRDAVLDRAREVVREARDSGK